MRIILNSSKLYANTLRIRDLVLPKLDAVMDSHMLSIMIFGGMIENLK